MDAERPEKPLSLSGLEAMPPDASDVLSAVERERASEGDTTSYRAIDAPSVEGMMELEGTHASMAADRQAWSEEVPAAVCG